MTNNSDERGGRPRAPVRAGGRARTGDVRPGRAPHAGGKGRPAREDSGETDTIDAPERKPPRAAQIETDEAARVLPVEERIAKVIARAGIASRRDAEAMIEAGRVTLNGQKVTSPALNVGPDDRIVVDGEALPLRERTRLWLFHKPRGLVTTFKDPQGRPTVFDALPEDMPRVVAIGRLDMNTEGLLLLTNDGGLAKVIAHPETGWTRRYRVRAFGEIDQAQLDRLRNGVTIEGVEYGPVEASLDRVQGDNMWISLALREGKNREVKRILEHLGLQVNRLIRLSFGPFQLGELEAGLVEEIRTKVLKEQLGPTLAVEAGVDWESPVRSPIAAFGNPVNPPARDGRAPRTPEPRRAGPDREVRRGRDERPNTRRDSREERPSRPRERSDERPARGGEREEKRPPVWRADAGERPDRPKRFERREDPKAERVASAERPRTRMPAIEKAGGKRVLVERIKPTGGDDRESSRHRRERGAESMGERPERTARPERPARPERDARDRPPPRGDRGGFAQPGFAKPGFAKPAFGKPAFGKPSFGKSSFGGRPGAEDGRGRPGGEKRPFGQGRPGAEGGRGRPTGEKRSFGADRPGGEGGRGRPFGEKRPFGAGRPGRPSGGAPSRSGPPGRGDGGPRGPRR